MTIEDLYRDIGADLGIVIARFGGNKALLERFVKKFPGDKNYEYLEEAVAATRYMEIEQAAHTLKGVSANLGFSELSDSCAAIVTAMRQDKYDTIGSLFEKMQADYRLVTDSIKRLE